MQSSNIQVRTVTNKSFMYELINSLHYRLMEKLIPLIRSAHTYAIIGNQINMLDTVIILNH